MFDPQTPRHHVVDVVRRDPLADGGRRASPSGVAYQPSSGRHFRWQNDAEAQAEDLGQTREPVRSSLDDVYACLSVRRPPLHSHHQGQTEPPGHGRNRRHPVAHHFRVDPVP